MYHHDDTKCLIRPDQFDFSFCGPARMIFFSNWNKNITKKNIKSLLEAKIWFLLSSRNNRRNIVFLRSAKEVNKEYILTVQGKLPPRKIAPQP